MTNQQTQAVILQQTGGTDVLHWKNIDLPTLSSNDVLVRHQAIGINFIDIYYRTGLYPVTLPSRLGTEAAGIVEAVGSDVQDFEVGDRVAYCTGPLGAYAQARVIPSDFLIKLPDDIHVQKAAAMMLKGLTAQYLVRQTYAVKEGDWLLLHAAAGGVGLLVAQWASSLGANIIGIVSTEEKREQALAAGCGHVLLGSDNLAKQVREITNGRGVDVVYDSVGKDTFIASLDCLRPRGLMVSFGNASGAVEPFSIKLLAQKGSLYLTRPTLFGYADTRKNLLAMAAELFEQVIHHKIQIKPIRTLTFSQVAQAHQQLASRQTIGATILIPE